MLRILSLFLILFSANILVAQTIRVAILDFDNISGIPKYDGLGKAMSSMLISDIEANVSPKRLQLVERAQVQKILKEQNFQASGSVNKSTAVQAGKILGVTYLLVGDIYILNDQLIINARLTNTETGDIVFAKKQEGKTVAWLSLKTIIAKDLATSLSQPFIEPTIPDKEIPVATITTFGNAIIAKDDGKLEKAEELINIVNEFSPEFKYINDLKSQLEALELEFDQVKKKVEILNVDPIKTIEDFIIKKDENAAIEVLNSALKDLRINDRYYWNKMIYLLDFKANILIESKKYNEAHVIIDSIKNIEPYFINGIITRLMFFFKTNDFKTIEKELQNININESIFFSEELKAKSKLYYEYRGAAFAAESGFKTGREVFLQPYEYSSLICEWLSERSYLSKDTASYWINKSINDITNQGGELLFYIIPFHFMRLNSSVTWFSLKNKVKLSSEYIKLCEKFVDYYSKDDKVVDFKELLIRYGWPINESFCHFNNDCYKIAFRKNINFLNFIMNLAHYKFLNDQQDLAYNMYCDLIQKYDAQYIEYESQYVKSFEELIKKDWVNLNILPNLDFSKCSLYKLDK